jgi:hypothetical protein
MRVVVGWHGDVAYDVAVPAAGSGGGGGTPSGGAGPVIARPRKAAS